MRTKLIKREEHFSNGYGAGSGSCETYEYLCPCGKGEITEEHDNVPGFRDHDVYIACKECAKKYRLDISKGVYNWDLIERGESDA